MVRQLLSCLGLLIAVPVAGQTAPSIPLGGSIAQTCKHIAIDDACAILGEAAKMLAPSYEANKAAGGRAAFNLLGYDATYIPAKRGAFSSTTDVFLVSRKGTNRLFVVITGTESKRDWFENAKFSPYTAKYADGQFYIPPGHAGFRAGMLNITQDVLKLNEFDRARSCDDADWRKSGLAQHLCQYGLGLARQSIETVIVGHSRGAGIGLVTATAFAGLEFQQRGGQLVVGYQREWPLKLHAVVGFAPPYAVYGRSDVEAGMPVPDGYQNHWLVLRDHGILDRTILFLNDRDIVPGLSVGYGRHFGYRYRIGRDDKAVYDGFDGYSAMTSGSDVSLFDAHSSAGYCRSVLAGLGRASECGER